jgi:hypothetical protein
MRYTCTLSWATLFIAVSLCPAQVQRGSISGAVLDAHGLFKGCSGPSLHQVDMNFVKKTKIRERVTFEIRAEMFNIFNHPNFSPSATQNINNSGFGALTSNFGAREIQFNGRISF